MAARAILLEKPRAARQIRRLPGPERDRIGCEETRSQRPRLLRDFPCGCLLNERLSTTSRFFADDCGRAAIFSATVAENSRISAYSDALTTLPPWTAPP
jgi:hypothetical protein